MTPERIDQSPGVHMSERMTAEELAEIERRHETCAPRPYNHCDDPDHGWRAHLDRAALLAHIRASQTPPHAVTATLTVAERGILEALRRADSAPSWLDPSGIVALIDRLVDANGILARLLAAEKPAPMTEEEREALRLAKDGIRSCAFINAPTAQILVNAIERLSASPTAPNTAQENERG